MLVVAAIVTGSSTAQAFQNEPNGFRGIKWGVPFSTVREQMVLVFKNDSIFGDVYERRDEKNAIGGAKLNSIWYGFFHDKFAGIYITANGDTSNRQALIATFEIQFGKGFKIERFRDDYRWEGTVSTVAVLCGSESDPCNVVIESVSLSKEKEAEKATTARTGKKDF
jgi:hypothetical protein